MEVSAATWQQCQLKQQHGRLPLESIILRLTNVAPRMILIGHQIGVQTGLQIICHGHHLCLQSHFCFQIHHLHLQFDHPPRTNVLVLHLMFVVNLSSTSRYTLELTG